jgi:release factor glutamine methyltransferase
MTVASLLREAADALSAAGIGESMLEAELLMAEALGMNRAGVLARLKDTPEADAVDRFHKLVARRASREPLQYITGRQEFYGLTFHVAPGVLVPRPETEIIVEEGVAFIKETGGGVAADIGTGSGCIAISLAAGLPEAVIYAIDSSEAALKIAGENAGFNGVEERVRFLRGDLYSPLAEAGLAGGLDLIVSNPPYIPSGDISGLQAEVGFEPLQALDGGPDGLDIVREIIKQAPEYLKPGGGLLIETGFGQAGAVRDIVDSLPGIEYIKYIRDFAGIERVLFARKS